MKKILFFLIITTIITTACSKSNDNNDGTTSSTIAPPAWILGTWLDENAGALGRQGFQFEADDFCVSSVMQLCYKSNYDPDTVTISQTVSNTSYRLTINMLGDSYVYAFTKKSDTQIEYNGKTYTKQK